MLDFLFALGQLVCFIGLLYGAILAVAHHELSGASECRYDPVTGHEWHREEGDHRLRLTIVPEAREAMYMASDPRPHETLKVRVLEKQLQEH